MALVERITWLKSRNTRSKRYTWQVVKCVWKWKQMISKCERSECMCCYVGMLVWWCKWACTFWKNDSFFLWWYGNCSPIFNRYPFLPSFPSLSLPLPFSLTTIPLSCYCVVKEPVSEQIPPITTIRYSVRCAVYLYRSRSSAPGFFFLPVMWSPNPHMPIFLSHKSSYTCVLFRSLQINACTRTNIEAAETWHLVLMVCMVSKQRHTYQNPILIPICSVMS